MESYYPFSSSDFNNENTHYLPPGFRFYPTDEELITHYLRKKVLVDNTFSGGAIADEVDLNKCEPWELPEKAKMGENEWYFFSLRDRKYPTGLRTNRATEAEYWTATGKDREIYSSTNNFGSAGMYKTRVFINSCLAKATDVAEDFLIYGIGLCAYVPLATLFAVMIRGTYFFHFDDDCTDDESQAQGSKKEGMLLRNSSPALMEGNKTSSSVNGSNNTWHVPLKGRDDNMNSRANIMQKVSSWITVLTFPGCLLLSNYKHYSSLCNDQIASLSICLALLGMLNLAAFLPSLILMAVSGAHFTRLQITMLLISAMLIIMKAYVPFLGFLFTHV